MEHTDLQDCKWEWYIQKTDLNQFELFGMAGGVSFMLQNDEGKRFVKKMSDLSYMA